MINLIFETIILSTLIVSASLMTFCFFQTANCSLSSRDSKWQKVKLVELSIFFVISVTFISAHLIMYKNLYYFILPKCFTDFCILACFRLIFVHHAEQDSLKLCSKCPKELKGAGVRLALQEAKFW